MASELSLEVINDPEMVGACSLKTKSSKGSITN